MPSSHSNLDQQSAKWLRDMFWDKEPKINTKTEIYTKVGFVFDKSLYINTALKGIIPFVLCLR